MALFGKKTSSITKSASPSSLTSVIKQPLFTEKAFRAHDRNQYVFLVDLKATKPEVKKAIEHLYNVSVDNVCIVRSRAQERFFRGTRTRGPVSKKAYVLVHEGQKIDMGAQA